MPLLASVLTASVALIVGLALISWRISSDLLTSPVCPFLALAMVDSSRDLGFTLRVKVETERLMCKEQSLCETCQLMREVLTPKGSRFLLCQLSMTNPDYPKYPPQPIVRCEGYQPGDRSVDNKKSPEEKGSKG